MIIAVTNGDGNRKAKKATHARCGFEDVSIRAANIEAEKARGWAILAMVDVSVAPGRLCSSSYLRRACLVQYCQRAYQPADAG